MEDDYKFLNSLFIDQKYVELCANKEGNGENNFYSALKIEEENNSQSEQTSGN